MPATFKRSPAVIVVFIVISMSPKRARNRTLNENSCCFHLFP